MRHTTRHPIQLVASVFTRMRLPDLRPGDVIQYLPDDQPPQPLLTDPPAPIELVEDW